MINEVINHFVVTPATPAPLGVVRQFPTAAGSALGVGAASLWSMPNATTAGRSNFLLQIRRSEWNSTPKIAVARGRSTIKSIRFGSDRSE